MGYGAQIASKQGTFDVRLNVEELRGFEQFADQFQYAIALAMNWTAKNDAVPVMREGLYHSRPQGAGFTDRGVSYTRGGIAFFRSARKNDLMVKVGAISEYLLAATEGTHDNSRPMGPNDIGAIPLGPTRDPKSKKLARRNDWPMQLIKRGLAFRYGVDHERKSRKVQVQGKDGKTRNRKVKDKPAPLDQGQVLYGTRKSPFPGQRLWVIENDRDIELQPVYPALPLVKEAFNGNFSDNLYKAIRKAVKTQNKINRARSSGYLPPFRNY